MNQNQPIFDSKLIIAIALSMVLWLAWQAHLNKKYPDRIKPTAESNEPTSEKKNAPEVAATTHGTPAAVSTVTGSAPVETFRYENESWSFDISSEGMSVRNVKLNQYTVRGLDEKITPAEDKALFSTYIEGNNQPLNFKISKVNENEFVGVAQFDGGTVTKKLLVNSATYSFETTVRAESSSNHFSGLVTKFEGPVHQKVSSSFLMPSYDHQTFTVITDGSVERELVSPDDAIKEIYTKAHVVGFGSQYFLTAIVDNSDVLPEFLAESNTKLAVGSLVHKKLNNSGAFSLKYKAYVGPKSYDTLKEVDSELVDAIDFGFFASIAKGIFKLMRFIHEYVGNWGLAIIILTILVRLLVLPLNVMSYRQMKGMSKIQPQMKILRERYKDDTQKLNQEMMLLWKEAKVNPLGGCLPMFVQIPIFFALYQVMGQSIELYQAPFALWIHDLSSKDPFFVLPVLVAVTMFVQQKITPTTMDPTQQKIMLFMPIVFSLFMLAMPSGVALYIFVSSLFAVVQQMFFMRGQKEAPAGTQIIDIKPT